MTSYSIEDQSFPKSFDLTPCQVKLNQISLLKKKLNLLYKHKIKKQPQELFERKTEEAISLPQYGEVNCVINKITLDIPTFISKLEDHFGGNETPVVVSSKAGSPPIQKLVSKARWAYSVLL